jgi:NAD dependent epimerase/dehydratase family enzyme
MYAFIHLEDLIGAIRFIASNRLEGIFNLCSPNPVDNATFTKSLAKASGTKLIIRIPTIILKAGMGEAHIMVAEGPYVLPSRLTGEGFHFSFPDIDDALQNLVRIH